MLHTQAHSAILLRSVRIVDPLHTRDEVADLAIVDGQYAEQAPSSAHVIDRPGLIACPGLIDMHVHLREPGQPEKETIATGTAAAAVGGFTLVACMPNTNPALDEPRWLEWVRDAAAAADHCDVAPIAALTRGRRGRELTDFAALQAAGAVAFSDDGDGVDDDGLSARVFERAAELGVLIIQHCEDASLARRGVMHAGSVAQRLGVPGLDRAAEEAMLARDLDLCRRYRARYHVAHISTAGAVELVRQAKTEGLPVTAEVCTHHLALTHEACAELGAQAKMNPPLREWPDLEACRAGLVDGTIDCIVTDHAPHTVAEKERGLRAAPFGIVGLETALGVAAHALIETGKADWPQVIEWLTLGPARVLQLPPPAIELGQRANLTVIAPDEHWTVDPFRFVTKGRNTPFSGWRLAGRAVATIRGPQLAQAQR